MRVYLPTTLPGLATSYQAGEVGPAPLDAFAVTPGLREWYLSDDVEELEYAALLRAAQASLRLLAADPAAPRRRVVVAADVPAGLVRAEPVLLRTRAALGLVRVGEPVALGKAAAVHVDSGEAAADVAAAAAAVLAADAGDDDARFTVDGAEGHELLWFATQEIPCLLGR